MIINVTQDDILHGIRCSHIDCPVARAASRAYKKPTMTATTYLYFWIIGDRLQLPEHVTAWIRDFDTDNAVAPITFEVL